MYQILQTNLFCIGTRTGGVHLDSLRKLQDLFTLKVSNDGLEAVLWYNDANDDAVDDWQWSEESVKSFLTSNKITFGLIHSNIDKLVKAGKETTYPLT